MRFIKIKRSHRKRYSIIAIMLGVLLILSNGTAYLILELSNQFDNVFTGSALHPLVLVAIGVLLALIGVFYYRKTK
ncbi:hypothetical protein DFO77_10210 [Marinilabilia salmonicolor]|uniref:Uncharacterized protein n=1 Tax=Marinilabilia salmonicolor TaxID=989 RepID=A0A368VCK6_9BACT|nr:hypothetical protein DFO77_10210 [Marinilabilia salmonicolor]